MSSSPEASTWTPVRAPPSDTQSRPEGARQRRVSQPRWPSSRYIWPCTTRPIHDSAMSSDQP
ncbi:MAG: hypothetical protein EPO40_10335 [Myxococcaceae bacterium]|nr:MAG: hypothetical protein EPO40_10335 [Myxococcaceae bacterium]